MAATTPVRIRDSAVYRIYGLVGYDDRLTRGRSPVRFRVDVFFTVLVGVSMGEKNDWCGVRTHASEETGA